MIVRSLWLMLLALSFASCGNDQAVPCPWPEPPVLPLDLRVTIDRDEVGLLQPVLVTVDRYRKQGIEVAFDPTVPDRQWVTKDAKTSDEREYGDGFWQRTTIVLLPIDGPGKLKIPPFRAETKVAEGEQPQVATTPAKVVEVKSLLEAEHSEEIEAPGDPFPTPPDYWLYLGIAGFALLSGLILWLLGRRRKQPQQALTVAVPAHVKALRELLRWKDAPRTTPAEIDAFYVGVSQVLRVYLEDRFELHAPERTTEEFLADLDGSAALVRDHGVELRRFLTQCDMVKFAKHVPTEDDHLTTYGLAESFIDATRADRAANEPAPIAAQAGGDA